MNTVEPAPALDAARAFGGLARLYGDRAAARIAGAHVVVVGVGGVGSWAAEALARSRVGCLTLIDLDHVAESNLNRQAHALISTVGQAKVQAMAARIRDINPSCEVRGVEDFVTPENWSALRPQGTHVVIDACDQFAAKLAMAQSALKPDASHAHIIVGAAGGKQLAHGVDVQDLLAVTHDPMLAKLRNRLRKSAGVHPKARAWGLPCVFSREPVSPSRSGDCDVSQTGRGLNCHGYGSAVHVTAVFGFTAAGIALQRLSNHA